MTMNPSVSARRAAANRRKPAETSNPPDNRSAAAKARNRSIALRDEAQAQRKMERMETRLEQGAGRNTGRIRRDLEAAQPTPKPSFTDRVESRVAMTRPDTTATPTYPPRTPAIFREAAIADFEAEKAAASPTYPPRTPAIFREAAIADFEAEKAAATPAAPKAEAPDPAEMQKLFRTVMGSSFDPKSRMDQRKMQDMMDFYTTSGGMGGRTPTRFALDYYKTLK